jgi:hypothetical protein
MVINMGADTFKYVMDSGPFKLFRKVTPEEISKDQLKLFCNCGEPCPCDEADGNCSCGEK